MTSQYEASEADVKAWFNEIKTRTGDDKRRILNKKQYEMIEIITKQVRLEINAHNTDNYDAWKPHRWSMHGGPGTGQSHVIKIIKTEMFEKVLQRKQMYISML